ncbi:sensor histidine kinase [Desulfohalovibrio reitneri]|uniref:sensor histidine kinase n=1 Tax=Desulfohalovibrio reitneri TaxID=1307759 RepID=UPI0004A6C6D1|nr:ATP-binding protein [Desulfohalovibrio reitneri]
MINRLKPDFWDAERKSHFQSLFNYRRIWLLSIILLAGVSLVPLAVMAVADYQITSKAIHSENLLRTLRVTSNTRRTVSFFLEERLAALRFALQETPYPALASSERLRELLGDLKYGFGGFQDIGLIAEDGEQLAYAGPFDLEGRDYSDQEWFIQAMKQGESVSDVFLGFRNAPHISISIRGRNTEGRHFLLRATLDIQRFVSILSSLKLSGPASEAFLINRRGVLQTPSSRYGDILQPTNLPVPPYSAETRSMQMRGHEGEPLIVGYAYIENSPFILMLVKRKAEVMKGWSDMRRDLMWFFAASCGGILVVIVWMSTFMVGKVYHSEQTRLATMQQMENTSRLASVGRLAAGVAHEINNPLAVINEKAGLMEDLLEFDRSPGREDRLKGLVGAIISSVSRCGQITRQLLSFARHFELKTEPVRVEEVVQEVLSFLRKEAEYRNIDINLRPVDGVRPIVSDRGKLQQIFLNIINNAFQAMNDGGRLDITVSPMENGWVEVDISDTGIGMDEDDLEKIFEPFFSTKRDSGGTGLGLSITYGLVRKLRGEISVKSEKGEGTTFYVRLPPERDRDENTAG